MLGEVKGCGALFSVAGGHSSASSLTGSRGPNERPIILLFGQNSRHGPGEGRPSDPRLLAAEMIHLFI